MWLKQVKICSYLHGATLAVMPIAVSFAMGLWKNGAEDISAAAAALACYSVMAVFVLCLKAFVLDSTTTVAKASRQAAWTTTLLLLRLIKSLADTTLHPLRARLIRPDTGPDVVLHRGRLSSYPEVVPPSSPCWPMGRPIHVRYH